MGWRHVGCAEISSMPYMEMCSDVHLKPISPSTLHPIDVNQWNPHSLMAMGMVLDHLGIFFFFFELYHSKSDGTSNFIFFDI